MSDEHIRKQAIDPQQSFIIQAPAGSGKTEVLTQRYLNLLAKAVHSPEEIIAITFTRKAAAEMRERLISNLENAKENEAPKEAHRLLTWQLAQAVLKTDQKHQWNLIENPNRLRILTIDALSAMLTAQVPLLSGFGAQAKIIDDARPLYQEAIHTTLEKGDPEIIELLLHFDNNAKLLTELLMLMLSKREQWLPYIFNDAHAIKASLENGLRNLIDEKLQRACKLIPLDIQHQLAILLNQEQFPLATFNQLTEWRSMLDILLKKDGQWRATLNIRQGFASDQRQRKKELLSLIAQLSQIDQLLDLLNDIMLLPEADYQKSQWSILQSLLKILPISVAQLHVLFRQLGSIDFIELSLGALNALGSEQAPTELALHLDYQIRHILLDEFQDTSILQFHLLEKLVQEWQPHDGKTLFLVGDPMQSIYRFRNAEVGLFLRAQQQGVAQLPLISLNLQQNFRSTAAVVNWINQTFKQIFPHQADITGGAIPYSPSIAVHPAATDCAIHYDYSDPEKIARKIQQLQHNFPEHSIAILVRSRSHLQEIIPALHHQAIAFQAIELDALSHRQEIIDLFSLTQALIHWGNRGAWFSVLRAPWCGLSLSDLHTLSQQSLQQPLWTLLNNYHDISALSSDAKARLAHLMATLKQGLVKQHQLPLAQWIKGIWLGLGGPSCLSSDTEYHNAMSFFKLLEEIQYEFSIETLEQRLEKLFAKPQQNNSARLQIMTIHKSKGLEFDHVILPELQKRTPADSNQILMWYEHPNADGTTDLILAPVKASDKNDDPIHRYLKHLENKKLQYESARLLYVAATRAKKSIHLYCKTTVDSKNQTVKKPSAGSFADLLWESCGENFIALTSQTSHTDSLSNEISSPTLYRLPLSSIPFNTAHAEEIENHLEQSTPKNYFTTDKQTASIFGSILHEALQQLAEKSLLLPLTYWQQRLYQSGIEKNFCSSLANQIQQALFNMQNCPIGQWILAPHQSAHCEYPLSLASHHKVYRYIIDRTFIDENGVRWIIDYKTSTPSEESLEFFLEKQKSIHVEKIECYADAFAQIENNPIHLGLYFPLCRGWITWSYASISY